MRSRSFVALSSWRRHRDVPAREAHLSCTGALAAIRPGDRAHAAERSPPVRAPRRRRVDCEPQVGNRVAHFPSREQVSTSPTQYGRRRSRKATISSSASWCGRGPRRRPAADGARARQVCDLGRHVGRLLPFVAGDVQDGSHARRILGPERRVRPRGVRRAGLPARRCAPWSGSSGRATGAAPRGSRPTTMQVADVGATPAVERLPRIADRRPGCGAARRAVVRARTGRRRRPGTRRPGRTR